MKTHFRTPRGVRRCNELKRDRRDTRDPMRVTCIRCLRGMVLDAERGPPDVLRQHHDSWERDAPGWMESVGHLGLTYEQSAALGTLLTGQRPSEMDRHARGLLLLTLRDLRGRWMEAA